MDAFLDWFDRNKYGIVGTIALHSLLLFLLMLWHIATELPEEERNEMRMEIVDFEEAERMEEEIMAANDPASVPRQVLNVTSNITAQTMRDLSPQRLAERVEQDLKTFEQQEFERLAQERRERGEEVEIPQLDPSKWDPELYKDRAAEPVKLEGPTMVWHDLEGRTREQDAPGYRCRSQGRVAISITVNAAGRVVKAELDRQRSASADDCMAEEALASAQRARFSPGRDMQRGTLFFLFMPQ